MAYATVADVEARIGRDLTPEEETQVTTLLEDVETIIKIRIPDLDAKVLSGEIPERLVVMIEVNAVVRVLRNPEAYVSETDGNYSYTRSNNGATGYLDLLPIEWDWLFGGSGMFQIIPVSPYGDRVEGGYVTQPDAKSCLCPPSWGFTVRVP
jgi:hypothetical protein